MLEFRDVAWEALRGTPDFEEWVKEYAAETTNEAIPVSGLQSDYYDGKDAEGMLFPVGAFDGEKLVGLAGIVAYKSGHYPFPMVALDTFYLRRDWRKGPAGLRFLKAVREKATALGAPGLVVTAPPGSVWDRICERRGLTHINNIWWCRCE